MLIMLPFSQNGRDPSHSGVWESGLKEELLCTSLNPVVEMTGMGASNTWK